MTPFLTNITFILFIMELQSFKKSLNASTKELKEVRVLNFVKEAKMNADLFIQEKEREIMEKESRLAQLLDLGESTTVSISQKLRDIDSKKLMAEVYQLTIDIDDAKRELKIMTETRDSLFPSDEKV